jgi:hypothetical protein
VGRRALTLERFQDLADAFGGDVARWPEADRAAGLAFARAEPSATAAILAEASALDRLLAASPGPAPSLALREAVIAAAPRPRRRAIDRRWVGLGASLAAASIAGVLAGAAAAPIAASHLRMRTADTAGDAARWLGEPADMTAG